MMDAKRLDEITVTHMSPQSWWRGAVHELLAEIERVAAFAVMWIAIDGLIRVLSVANYQEWTLIIVIAAAWAIDHNRHEVRL